MRKQLYPSDLTNREWNRIKKFIPAAKPGGRPRAIDPRAIVNAVCYVRQGGIAWRMMPHDLPNWKTVYHYFRLWRTGGLWKQMHDRIRGDCRVAEGRDRQPSAALLDRQSVKTTDVGGPARGYAAGKKIAGRTRHLWVDVLGWVLVAVVHSAGVQDWHGARDVCEHVRHRFSRLRHMWADSISGNGGLPAWVWELRDRGKLWLEIVRREPGQKGFAVLPRRWVVERTFGWFIRQRRLVRDYEYLPETSETMMYIAMTRLMLRRLENNS